MDLSADLDTFLSDFSIDVTVGSATVRGLFNEFIERIEQYDHTVIGSVATFTCKSSDVALNAIERNTVITISGKDYTVSMDPDPDGLGLTVLTLVVP